MAMSMIIRLVAGLLLGPGTLPSAPRVFLRALRAVDLNFGRVTLIASSRPRAGLFLAAEIDGHHIRTVVGSARFLGAGSAGRFGGVVLGVLVRGRLDVADRCLELQPEIDRRIDERGDRGEGDLSFAGIWLKLSPTWKPCSSTADPRTCSAARSSSRRESARASAAGSTPGAPVLKVM
jgi:hypothetical protein